MPSMVPFPIAFVMPSFEPGGTERQMIELVRRLDRERWQVHVACFRRRGAWLDRVATSAPVVEFPVRSFRHPSTLGQVKAFARWCSALGIAVVHTTDMPSNIFGLPAAALAGVPARVGNRREVNPGRTAAALVLQRAAYSCAHRVVANCRAAADRLGVEGVAAHKINVIPNGVAIPDFDGALRRTPARRVVVVANLRPEKGHDVLLRAASHIVRRFPDARFDVVGDGPERRSLEALSDELGLRGFVSFAGHREDVAARLAAADICVHPSRSEAFPNAVLEAMAAGLPIVASGVGGVIEVMRDGDTGLVVPPGDHNQLAHAIGRIMSTPTLARSLGKAARSEVAARYSFDRMIADFEAVYLRQLARVGRVPHVQLDLAVS
jgi:glycosyltransferase involved in cell wall biosynthesis